MYLLKINVFNNLYSNDLQYYKSIKVNYLINITKKKEEIIIQIFYIYLVLYKCNKKSKIQTLNKN